VHWKTHHDVFFLYRYPEQSETHRDRKKDFQKTVVFVCDVQECFRPSIDAFDGVVRSSKILIESAKIFNWPVFATEQVPSKLGRTAEEVLQCMREMHPENEEVVLKEKFPIAKSDFGMLRAILMGKDGDLNVQPNSLCGKESLAKMMYDADEIRVLLLGVEAHVCVYQTVKQIMEHNEKAGRNILKPFVLCDGVQSQRGVDREVALEKMKELGATMTTTEMFLFEEMGGAEHENFRDVAKTVRKYK